MFTEQPSGPSSPGSEMPGPIDWTARRTGLGIVRDATPASPCTDWCAPDECAPDEGFHVGGRIVAARGGPMADDITPNGAVDLVPTVGINRHPGGGDVVMDIQVVIRDSDGWLAPTEITDALPRTRMTAARALHLSDLLADAANEIDRLTREAGQ